MSTPPFWGDVGMKKWSPFLVLGTRSTIFWHLKTGTFAKSAQFGVQKNGTLGARNKKRRPLFHVNIPPKWWKRHLFPAFITFEWVLSQFYDFANFGHFQGRFPILKAKKLKVPFYTQRCAQIKKLKKTNQL